MKLSCCFVYFDHYIVHLSVAYPLFCVLLYLFAFFSPRFYRVCFIWSHLLHLSIQLYYYCLARTHSVQKVWNRISFRFQLEKIFLMGGKVKWISSFTTWTRFAIHSTHTHIVVTSFFIAWVIQYVFYFFTLHSPNLVKPVSHTRIATLRIVLQLSKTLCFDSISQQFGSCLFCKNESST